MKIEHYEFGKIVIEGREYRSDVIISESGVMDNWRRKDGHRIKVEDVSRILDRKPDILVIGTGSSGMMEVPLETRDFIESKGIEVVVGETDNACRLYNELSKRKTVIAALHLTC